tara:strand:- start:2865 stop:3737 length:873 start_codon:yes stop_codon:yes gene_type:complete
MAFNYTENSSLVGTGRKLAEGVHSFDSNRFEAGGLEDLREHLSKVGDAIQGGRTDYKLTTNPHNITYGGDEKYISDGGGDMYDSGNYTICMNESSPSFSSFTASGRSNSEAISYDDETVTTPNGSGVTDYRYIAGGHATTNLNSHGALVVAATTGNSYHTYCGFAKGGNSGADGSGNKIQVDLYNGSVISGFTVYASYMATYNAGDPSVCDLYILMGHPSWGTIFGTINKYNYTNTGYNTSAMWSEGGSQKNVLAVATLAARTSGNLPVESEMQGIVTAIVGDIQTEFGY